MTPEHDLNNLRLEVETPTEGLPNLVQNPSGEKGAWFWLTAVSNTAMTSSGTALTFKTTTSQACRFATDYMPVTPGKYVAARFEISAITSAHNLKVRFDWYDAANVLVTWTSQTVGLSTIGVNYVPAQQVPSGIAYCKARFDFYNGAGNPSANAEVTFTRAMVTWTDSASVYSARTNLVRNPSFETGTTGWTGNTLTASTTQAKVGTQSLRMHRTSSGLISVSTNHSVHPIPVTAGDTYTLGLNLYSTKGNRLVTREIVWLNSSGVEIGAAGSFEYSTANAWVEYSGSGTAPTGAAYAKPRIKISDVAANEYHYMDAVWMVAGSTPGSYFDGATVASGYTYAWTGTAHASTSTETSATGAYPYSEPHGWLDILGSVYEISVNRQGLDVGTMTVSISDAALDPATTTDLRPGKKIRLRASANGGASFGNVYEGKIKNAKVDYDRTKETTPRKRTLITLTAVDALATAVNRKESRGVAAISELPYLLEGKGIPWKVNGSGDQVLTTPVIVSANANASVVDQVAITRDTARGYAWVDRYNTLTVYDAANLANSWAVLFSDNPSVQNLTYASSYSAINVDFDTDRCINEVTVKWLRYNKAQGTSEEIVYGPYRDQASIDTWGAYSAEFTIHGASESGTSIAAYAAAILAANATPQRRANSLTMPVKTAKDIEHATKIDLYTGVQVVYGTTVLDTYKVTSIKHTITPQRWLVDYGFEVVGSVAAPQQTPTPGSTATGPPHASRSRTSNLTVPDNTWTTVTFGTSNGTGNGLVDHNTTTGEWTIPTPGVYLITARVHWDSNATNRRRIRVAQGGTALAEHAIGTGTTSSPLGTPITVMARFAENATFTIDVHQNSGGNLAAVGGTSLINAEVYRLGD